jgi:hypothetical protein
VADFFVPRILEGMTNTRAAPRVVPLSPTERHLLVREAFRLEWLTIGWMTVEAVVGIASGVAAGSLVLVALCAQFSMMSREPSNAKSLGIRKLIFR